MLAEPLRVVARAFLRAHPPPGRPLLCALTGSHIYGFPSADSDLDLKAIHLAPTRACLGLDRVPKSFDRLLVFRGVECDYTSTEAGPALALMLRGNGNLLERIFSPCQLLPGADDNAQLQELRELARGALSLRCYAHYAGFFRGICREHRKAALPCAKSLLYAYRVALSGCHLLRERAVETRLDVLAPAYGFDEALELIEQKRAGGEKQPISPADDALHRAAWPKLEGLLEEARDASALPEVAPNTAACSEWLIRQRLGLL